MNKAERIARDNAAWTYVEESYGKDEHIQSKTDGALAFKKGFEAGLAFSEGEQER